MDNLSIVKEMCMAEALHSSFALVPEIIVVPFVLATPHHAAAEVVAYIDQAALSAAATACVSPAIAGCAMQTGRCGPKIPPGQ